MSYIDLSISTYIHTYIQINLYSAKIVWRIRGEWEMGINQCYNLWTWQTAFMWRQSWAVIGTNMASLRAELWRHNQRCTLYGSARHWPIANKASVTRQLHIATTLDRANRLDGQTSNWRLWLVSGLINQSINIRLIRGMSKRRPTHEWHTIEWT